MAKLEILTPAEQTIFNAPPNFSPDEQNKYFCLPAEVAVWLKSVDSITNKAGFILLFGYCLAGARFYQPRQFYESDLKVICHQYGFDRNEVQLTKYNQRTFNYHKQIIRVLGTLGTVISYIKAVTVPLKKFIESLHYTN